MKHSATLWLGVTTAVFVCAVGASGAKAATFSFNGFSGAPAPGSMIDFKLQNFEVLLDASTPAFGSPGGLNGDPVHDAPIVTAHQVSGGALTTPGQQLYGILNISSIQSPDGSKQYWTQSATQQLTGEFYGYTVKNVTNAGTSSEVAQFNGGALKMFFSGSPTFNSIPGPFMGTWTNIAASNGVDAAGQSLFLSALGVGGILPQPPATNIDVSLSSTFTSFTATRFTGVGDGFFTITASFLPFGADAFDMSTAGAFPYPGSQDLSFKSNFDSRPAGTVPNPGPLPGPLDLQNNTGWSVAGQDPLELQFTPATTIPEPASLTLWGIVTLGSGLMVLRRNRRLKRAG